VLQEQHCSCSTIFVCLVHQHNINKHVSSTTRSHFKGFVGLFWMVKYKIIRDISSHLQWWIYGPHHCVTWSYGPGCEHGLLRNEDQQQHNAGSRISLLLQFTPWIMIAPSFSCGYNRYCECDVKWSRMVKRCCKCFYGATNIKTFLFKIMEWKVCNCFSHQHVTSLSSRSFLLLFYNNTKWRQIWFPCFLRQNCKKGVVNLFFCSRHAHRSCTCLSGFSNA